MNEHLSPRGKALYGLWARVLNKHKDTCIANTPDDWNQQQRYLSESGVGMEEALDYMYREQPSFEDFVGWVGIAGIIDKTQQLTVVGNILTAADHDFWAQNGYLVVKDVVSLAQCEAAREAIWEFLGASIDAPDSWYQMHDGKKGMMLNFFQHPSLAANRNSVIIKKAYQELYGAADIYLLVDKVSFNAPEMANHKFMGSHLHWDVSLHQPIPFVLQGLLYLNDVKADEGAFHCVPGFHNNGVKWLESLPEGTDPRMAALTKLKPVPVPGNAGDLVIWHQALPHCATANKGKIPRMVQYIAYKPLIATEATVWI